MLKYELPGSDITHLHEVLPQTRSLAVLVLQKHRRRPFFSCPSRKHKASENETSVIGRNHVEGNAESVKDWVISRF